MVSDRDSAFLNAVWEELMRLSGTKLNFTTAYHPQSDGQTEVRNRRLEQYLRAFTADRPSKWFNFLPWAELALNCFHHEGLGTSPFNALYGREPPTLIAAEPSARTPLSVAHLIRQRGELLVTLRKNLEKAQQRMREVANRHRRDVSFEIGDRVLLKLQQYRQHSVARPQSAKLARRYYGPFEVVERIGPVAYRLKLPDGCRIHNVFHVSLLRAYVESAAAPSAVELPDEFFQGRPAVRPVELLDRRVMLQGGRTEEHGLVRWPDGSTSWEPTAVLKRQFPSLLLEDKEASIGGGVDTSTTSVPTPAEREDDGGEIEGEKMSGRDSELGNDEEESSREEMMEEESTVAKSRPRRQTRPPERFMDYVKR